jgi:hypothetical protein
VKRPQKEEDAMDNMLIHEAAETALALARAGVLELQAVLWGLLCELVAALGVPDDAVETVTGALEAAARNALDRWVAYGS